MDTVHQANSEENIWLFSYGLEMFAPRFEYTHAYPAFIEDWRRVFGLSFQRRGRTRLSISAFPAPEEACFGRAYRVDTATFAKQRTCVNFRRVWVNGLVGRTSLSLAPEYKRSGSVLPDELLLLVPKDQPLTAGWEHCVNPSEVALHIKGKEDAELIYQVARFLEVNGVSDPYVDELEYALEVMTDMNW